MPIRKAVTSVNALNISKAPVAFFGPSLAGHLSADALYVSWYNDGFKNQLDAVKSPDDLSELFIKRGVDYVIWDESWEHSPRYAVVLEATREVVRHGPISVRVLKDDYRFSAEILVNPDFRSLDGWGLSAGSLYHPDEHYVEVNVEKPAVQQVAVTPGRRYRNGVTARCSSGQGRVQVNWLGADMQFLKADIKVFDCKTAWTDISAELVSPVGATHAVVYASGHGREMVDVRRVSFK